MKIDLSKGVWTIGECVNGRKSSSLGSDILQIAGFPVYPAVGQWQGQLSPSWIVQGQSSFLNSLFFNGFHQVAVLLLNDSRAALLYEDGKREDLGLIQVQQYWDQVNGTIIGGEFWSTNSIKGRK